MDRMMHAWNALLDKLQSWLDAVVLMLPNLLFAILVLIAFFLAARFTRTIVTRFADKFLSQRQALSRLVVSTASFIVTVIGFLVALSILKLDKAVFSILAGVGVVGLALGFAFQNIAANMMSGLLIVMRRPFGVGHIIKSNDYFGTVKRIDLRNTEIETPEGQLVLIPNKEVFESPLVSYTKLGKRRLDLSVGVSYGDDLEKVKKLTEEAVSGIEELDHNRKPPLEVFFSEFGDSSINFVLRLWLNSPEQLTYVSARSKAIMAIKRCFDQNDVTIPFPIRTLDFGIKGGETLKAHLLNGSQQVQMASTSWSSRVGTAT